MTLLDLNKKINFLIFRNIIKKNNFQNLKKLIIQHININLVLKEELKKIYAQKIILLIIICQANNLNISLKKIIDSLLRIVYYFEIHLKLFIYFEIILKFKLNNLNNII